MREESETIVLPPPGSFQGLSLWLYVGERNGDPDPGGCCRSSHTVMGCWERCWSGEELGLIPGVQLQGQKLPAPGAG